VIDDFLRELDRQTGLYREMLATTEVARLQSLLREVGDIDVRIAPVRRRWAEVAPTLDVATAERAGKSIEAARDVLSRLVDRFVPPVPSSKLGQAYGS